TCFARPDRDLLVAPGGAADRAEPLELSGTVAKLGIDATRKAADRADHRIAAPPAEALENARRRLAEGRRAPGANGSCWACRERAGLSSGWRCCGRYTTSGRSRRTW